MAIRRFAAVPLPKSVFRSGTRYYHQAGRHLPNGERGKLTRIPFAPDDPRFWAMAQELNAETAPRAGTFAALIAAYKASPRWTGEGGAKRLADATRRAYAIYLAEIEAAWATLSPDDLQPKHVAQFRAKIAKRGAPAANMALAVLKALLVWGVNEGLCERNAAADIRALETETESHRPWPDAAWRYVLANAPEDIRRFAILARATGQRGVDVVRMGPRMMRHDRIDLTIQKTRRRHVCVLTPADAATIRAWPCGELAPWVANPSGGRTTEGALRARFVAWRSGHELTADLTLHGLRALAVCDARLAGMGHQEIAALYGMSLAMVMRYSRHMDQETAAENARKRG